MKIVWQTPQHKMIIHERVIKATRLTQSLMFVLALVAVLITV